MTGCACGCGTLVDRRWVRGHHRRGLQADNTCSHTPEANKKRSASLKAFHKAKWDARMVARFGALTEREQTLLREALLVGYRSGYQAAYHPQRKGQAA